MELSHLWYLPHFDRSLNKQGGPKEGCVSQLHEVARMCVYGSIRHSILLHQKQDHLMLQGVSFWMPSSIKTSAKLPPGLLYANMDPPTAARLESRRITLKCRRKRPRGIVLQDLP
jgi:hypothetical protein